MKPQTRLEKLIIKAELNNGLTGEDYSEYLKLQKEIGENMPMDKIFKKIRVAFNYLNSRHKGKAKKVIHELMHGTNVQVQTKTTKKKSYLT